MNTYAEHWKFRPHPLFQNGHMQTVGGIYLPRRYAPYKATLHIVPVEEGAHVPCDRIALHEDRPEHCPATRPVVLLIHGLSGSHKSTYMCRMTERLTERGYTTFRMDMRGCGAGRDLARRPAHCGCWGDVAAAVDFISQRHPEAPLLAVGFSMGGTLLLNLLAESGATQLGNLRRVLAICPPIDLFDTERGFRTRLGRAYDRFFVRNIWKQIVDRWQLFPDAAPPLMPKRPRRLREIDELVIAPVSGFESAEHYYSSTQPGPKLASIKQPATIIAADDDPIVPTAALHKYPHSNSVETIVLRHGGHLGFLARANGDPDIRWMDWRIIDWIEHGR